jgi:hypothetical protein
MKLNREKLMVAINVLAWIVFIGLMIKAGSVIISYCVSIGNVGAAKNLYNGMDLYTYRVQNFAQYSLIVGYKILECLMQAFIAFVATSFLGRINLSKPSC